MDSQQTLQECLPGLWRIAREFWPHIRQQWVLIAGSLLALFAGIGLRLLEPWPLKFVFDRIILADDEEGLSGIPFLDELGSAPLLTAAALGLVAIIGLRALADFGNTVGFALIGNRVLTQVRNELYRHLQGLSLSFHTKAKSGDLIVRVIGDINMLKDVIVTALLPLLANLFVLLGMLGFMWWLQWKLAVLVLATLPLFWLAVLRLSRRIREAARRQRQREGALASTVAEAIGAIKVVQALSLQGMFAQLFFQRNQKSQHEDVRGSRLAASLGRTVDVLTALARALVLWYGARLVIQEAMTPGDLLVFLAYLRKAFHPMQDFAKYTARLAKATAAGERVLDLLARTPEVCDLPGAVPAPAFQGAVHFAGVTFAYEPGRNVLEQIDLEIEAGQHVALVGPSGIGKSTLVSLLLRLYDPVEGRVLIDGRDIRSYTLDSLRSQISVVLQDSPLFAASVRDNIAYAAADAAPEEIEAVARLANAHDFIEILPQGYETILGERGATLSHGQRQRIAIARAAIRNAPILILDEPTTGLDRENEHAVMEGLEQLARGRTTFLITHNLAMAARADLILYLEDGRILERGTHAELLRAGGRYAALYALRSAPASPASPEEESHALAS